MHLGLRAGPFPRRQGWEFCGFLGFLRAGRTGLLVSSVCKPVACWAAQVPPSVETLAAHFCFHLLFRACFGTCTRADLSLGSVKEAFPSMDKAAWWLLHPGC